ncbi:MAG: GTP 3',8-cyclase MoaA [Planctomycetia bacterium]|nr:GTP 3',8-cyclase MoaA [Planctomycetia bacterium]
MSSSAHNLSLVDTFGRVHTDLRISVTDRCNIRCFYCMPNENVTFKPHDELLTFEEIERFVRIVAPLGINKLRLTGGEPLVRRDLPLLVKKLAAIDAIEDLALTTNGILLAEHAEALRQAGLRRINISLDALDRETFRAIARRDGLEDVLAGIAAAQRVGFEKIKLNAVAIRGLTEAQIIPLGRFARERGLELRFIEYMPLDAERTWRNEQVLSGNEILATLEAEFGPLEPVPALHAGQPASDYRFVAGGGIVGFINPVTEPFCGDCNRLRITAEGQLRNCLFSQTEFDVRALLRSDADDEHIVRLIRDCIAAKLAGHGIRSDDFSRPARAMYQIGG